MKSLKYMLLLMVVLMLSVSSHSAVQAGFHADFSNCSFNYTDPLNGKFSATISNATGEMSGLTSTNGTFRGIFNPDGTILMLTSSSSSAGKSKFTFKSNQLVDVYAGTLTDSVPGQIKYYTSVTLRKSGKTYSSKTASASGTTDRTNYSNTNMSLDGSF